MTLKEVSREESSDDVALLYSITLNKPSEKHQTHAHVRTDREYHAHTRSRARTHAKITTHTHAHTESTTHTQKKHARALTQTVPHTHAHYTHTEKNLMKKLRSIAMLAERGGLTTLYSLQPRFYSLSLHSTHLYHPFTHSHHTSTSPYSHPPHL
jgi:hypothetical protein